ncbi:MAG: DUF2293 domain-containing protein [Desulforhopalus sp.]
MPEQTRTVVPTDKERVVLAETGEPLTVPRDWELLPPGDGPLTRLVKAKGATWAVQIKKGRRTMSRGVWARGEHIEAAQRELAARRASPGYAARRERDAARKEKHHAEYVRAFYEEVVRFLAFHPRYAAQAQILARRVTEIATPVGSGTVARTRRIPLAERAGRAVIAWMRHQTTGYDQMKIVRVKGRRREVRRQLAARSALLLDAYRRGEDVAPYCPLQLALQNEQCTAE